MCRRAGGQGPKSTERQGGCTAGSAWKKGSFLCSGQLTAAKPSGCQPASCSFCLLHRDRRDDRDRRDERRSGGDDRGRGRSAWDATPSRQQPADEWEVTPARSGGSSGSGGTSRRPSSVRDTPLAGSRSGWDAAAAAPDVARAGGGGGKGGYKPRSSVRFDVERSPALTPAWQSSSWSKERKAGERRDVERSPDLQHDRTAEAGAGGSFVCGQCMLAVCWQQGGHLYCLPDKDICWPQPWRQNPCCAVLRCAVPCCSLH